VDLQNAENDSDLSALLKRQREDLIKQQQKEEREKPRKLATYQCIICLDKPKDLTATSCGKFFNLALRIYPQLIVRGSGHLFCYICLMEALHAGGGGSEKRCPICRTTINPRNNIVSLELKLVKRGDKGKTAQVKS